MGSRLDLHKSTEVRRFHRDARGHTFILVGMEEGDTVVCTASTLTRDKGFYLRPKFHSKAWFDVGSGMVMYIEKS